MEGAALHHHVLAQRLGTGELDDLEQRVFHHRAGQSRGDILYRRALLLRLLDIGIHKHGTARAQIDGLGRKQRLGGEALRRIAHGHGEVFQKRPAARRAGLVEQNGIYRATPELDTLHILPADVQHAVHAGIEEGGRRAVRDGLYLSFVQTEGGFEQLLAIARGAGARNSGPGGHQLLKLGHGAFGCFHGAALVAGVEGIEQLTLHADKRQFGGG